ncbi:MAG: sigma-54 dependent transcriptional regulator [Gammaproteobacteria bacterium]|nr:sigma-54 dependent transcriptional regulator [Gammaproteobacteria bacterium]
MATALIVDDDSENSLLLARLFKEQGFAAEVADSFSDAREALLREMPDVAMLCEELEGRQSLDLLNELDVAGAIEVYLMSENPTLHAATRAMQLGVSDYFEKPVDTDRLVENLSQLAEDAAGGGDNGANMIVGESAPIKRMNRLIRKVAPSEAAVLLTGESGTGKELAALTIHSYSQRADRPFVALNCSAVAPELMESELFGHRKGSFTGATKNHRGFFERANHGTLFLDEITEMAPALQAKLLRTLEAQTVLPVGSEKEIAVDVRIVAATNRDPQAAIGDGSLREDLYFRIAQFPIRVPPLRERGNDIDLLARHFVAEQNEQQGIEKTIADDALDVLRVHDWPGNVRELRNAIVHGHLLSGAEISADDLPDQIPSSMAAEGKTVKTQIGLSLAELERRHVLATLAHFDGDKKKAAEILGISLKTLYNRLKKYGVS